MSKKATILTVIGAFGVIATAVTTAKATPKALTLLEEARKDRTYELTILDKIKIAGPVYIPSIAIGISTIVCIFGANALNKRQQALMASSYALLNNSYNRYREKIKDIYGEKLDNKLSKEAFIESKIDSIDEILDNDEYVLFCDYDTLEFFEAPIGEVIQKTVIDNNDCIIISTRQNMTRH